MPKGRAAVDAVNIRGARNVDDSDIAEKLATSPSPKFLSLFRGVVFDYELLDRFVLQRDLARVERFYRARGYYDARAMAGQVIETGKGHVRVEVIVDEGQPVRIEHVTVEGIEGLPPPVRDAALKAAAGRLPHNQPFAEDDLTTAEGDVRRALSDRGYAYAKVTRAAAVDLVRHTAKIVLSATPEKPARFGKVTIEGLGELPAAPVRRAMDIQEGEPYSEADLDSAQQAILELGVFASVEMKPDLRTPPPDDHVVPITVKVEPARLRTVRLGGGFEFDQLRADVHGLVGWESKNFLGGFRSFQVTLKPGLVFYPTRINNLVAPERFFPEEKLRAELRQPGFLEARTTGFVRPEFNVFPVLLNPDAKTPDPVLGYAEFRGSVGVDRTIWKLYAALSQNVQIDIPFMYQGAKDPTLSNIVVSYPELLTQLDFRDDAVHPRKGIFLGNDLQVAGLGGNVRDIRVQPEIRTYIPVAAKGSFVTRLSVGFLFPSNYGDAVRDPARAQLPQDADRTRDLQVMFFRGFFSGGSTSNRGYPFRGVSPHAFVPFLNPETAAAQVQSACVPGSTDPNCTIPIGGFTLWEFQNELRFVINGPLAGAVFCDMSDVSPQTVDIRLTHLHLSCGVGARYDTPVGPIRLDIGYRIPGLQVLGGRTRDEKTPQDLFGIPIAIAFGLGEAF
ncbi:BamA/TamA family outer membrane protein [Pendulispora brunnea]|uniref:BamA/TamA family outer membrane protein n=1 Tax=Pendulispora brunnea TaxID=2905690 RepID=A0ABZ2KIA9_9BACT